MISTCCHAKLVFLSSHASDCHVLIDYQTGFESTDYLPAIPALGGGDSSRIYICRMCGKIQNWDEAKLEEVIREKMGVEDE